VFTNEGTIMLQSNWIDLPNNESLIFFTDGVARYYWMILRNDHKSTPRDHGPYPTFLDCRLACWTALDDWFDLTYVHRVGLFWSHWAAAQHPVFK